MKACPSTPFTTLLADTILEHGPEFGASLLAPLPDWEATFWWRHPAIRAACVAYRGLQHARAAAEARLARC